MDGPPTQVPSLYFFALVALGLFFGILLFHVLRHTAMFTKRYGRSHRIVGACYLAWLILGYIDLFLSLRVSGQYRVVYDVVLPVLGTVLTLTAAHDFRHAHLNIKNVASGVLDDNAIVTVSEMEEHSFYQMINVAQLAYIAAVSRLGDLAWWEPSVLLLCVTSPWLFRSWFPINHFSDNYTKKGRDTWALTSVLYRLKKYQYLLYKHCLLHGLNITVALRVTTTPIADPYFMLYWMALNTAYTMEFFLQTLVRRRYMTQTRMLWMNQGLMVVSTIAALRVILDYVSLPIAAVSLLLNLIHRKSELTNVCGLFAVAIAFQYM